ncbi:hypothetical protein [Noviluteimonas gilva]|uniref:Uncharacterized protein n=1 Tax=Noviluteimonas gilva TaxID=2682097 RepID=A0A7C9M4B7_9GAMM|nr:hypothetical protein [Lysobacter gilvus]MUV14602.1 hypothetical protein [Lysobacter gilvus]
MTSQLNSFCVALVACIVASTANAANPSVTLQRDLSPGVRLHSVDGQRVWPTEGRTVELSPGVHTLQIRYAFDFQRDQNGGFVATYDFECEFAGTGPYTLRSKDSRIVERVPTIWIEGNGQAPNCRVIEI